MSAVKQIWISKDRYSAMGYVLRPDITYFVKYRETCPGNRSQRAAALKG